MAWCRTMINMGYPRSIGASVLDWTGLDWTRQAGPGIAEIAAIEPSRLIDSVGKGF